MSDGRTDLISTKQRTLKHQELLKSQRVRRATNCKQLVAVFTKRVLTAGTDWIKLAEKRNKWVAFVNAVMNVWVLCSGNVLTSLATISFARISPLPAVNSPYRTENTSPAI
jgi:hypothetical protein